MQGLTDRQQQVLRYIRQSINERGYPPTLREIGNFMGIRSTNGVNDHLRALERKGYLLREDMKSRALRPTRNGAGAILTEAIEQPEDTVRVDRVLLGGAREVFGLRIAGDSMIKAGINDGDYVFVRKQLEAHKGDIVIALVG